LVDFIQLPIEQTQNEPNLQWHKIQGTLGLFLLKISKVIIVYTICTDQKDESLELQSTARSR
jgi:hypothetical protein